MLRGFLKVLQNFGKKGNRLFLLALLLILVSTYACSPSHKKTYVIARDRTWYPINLLGKETVMTAFVDELIREIAEVQDLNIRIIPSSSTINLDGLDKDLYDAKVTSITPSVLTRNDYLFSRPFYLLGPVLIVRRDSSIESLKDMEGKVLGIMSNDGGIFKRNLFPDLILTSFKDAGEGLESLEKNKIQGLIIDALIAYRYLGTHYVKTLKVISSPLTGLGFRLIAKSNSSGKFLIDQFDEGFIKLRDNGTYSNLLEKWGLTETEISFFLKNRKTRILGVNSN